MYNPNLLFNKYFKAETRAEWCFAVLTCLLWGYNLFFFIYVALDNTLHTGTFFRTTGLYLLYTILALGSINYFRTKVKPNDFIFATIALLLYYFSPNIDSVESKLYANFTAAFIVSLPLYFIGVSIDFSKLKKVLWVLSIFSIVASSFYYLIHVRATGYAGSTEVTQDNMDASYIILYPTIYVLWYTLKEFNLTNLYSLISLITALLGVFDALILGTRGPVVCIVMFILAYMFFYKITNHKILYGSVFILIIAVLWYNIDAIMLYLMNISESLGYSTRIFVRFLNDADVEEASNGRAEYYPTLIRAMKDSPIWGYGVFGSFKLIGYYTHNIFAEMLVTFGYVIGGILIYVMGLNTYKGFKNNLPPDENNFLFVLLFEGIVCSLFTFVFFLRPVFFLFLGYSVQMAYRRNNINETPIS